MLVGQLRGSEAFRQRLEAENEGDLTRILAGLTNEADALRDEISALKLQLVQLQNTQQADSASVAAAAGPAAGTRVLAGTVARQSGPGLTMRIDDPEGGVLYDTLIDVVAELRDAGAEAIAINGRRVGAGSAFGEADDRVTIDGITVAAPYTVAAIGPAATLEGGLKIPGGALDVLASLRGVDVDLQRSAKIEVPALANPPRFRVGKASLAATHVDSATVNVPEDLKYTSDHEWIRDRGRNRVKVGITDFAQDALGDVVYVGLPAVGDAVTAGQSCGEVESTKSVSEIYAPVSGTIVASQRRRRRQPRDTSTPTLTARAGCS